MGTGWIIAGVFTTILSISFKIYFGKKLKEDRKVVWYLHIMLQKGNSLSVLSYVQLLGLIWVLEGLLISLFGYSLKNIPDPLVFAGECFIPLLILYLITKLFVR